MINRPSRPDPNLTDSPVGTSQQGYLRGWFSGWGGWYGGSAPTQSEMAQIETELEDMDADGKSEHMNKEIYDEEAKIGE